jgi:3'(2'), 5'-bisphosphate nucleotidase
VSGPTRTDLAALLPPVIALARDAGRVVLEHYRGDFDVRRKADRSPVTGADEASEQLILAGLRKLTPGILAVSEEAAERGEVDLKAPAPQHLWLVDPLDGTREFVKRNGEFCINIGLVENGQAVLGVLHAPVSGAVYAAAGSGTAFAENAAGTRRAIKVRPMPAQGVTVLESRSHGDAAAQDAVLSDYKIAERKRSGSAIKFGFVAEGVADIYIRLGRTMEWDTAAGQAILEGAGGKVRTLSGVPLHYGKPGYDNPDFIASGF